MHYKKRSLTITFVLTIALAACSLQEPEFTGTSLSRNEQNMFSRFVAFGDNYIAGYQNAALVHNYQQYSFANLMAQQGGASDFQQPLLGYPGLGAESHVGFGVLELHYLDNPATPQSVNPDPVVLPAPYADYPDFDPNDPYISDSVKTYEFFYSNLGIPAMLTADIATATQKFDGDAGLNPMIDVVLRQTGYTVLQQVRLFQPSLIACWIGTYDILGYAIFSPQGLNLDEPTPVSTFETELTKIVDSLLVTQAPMVVGNIPDFTSAPYFNTVPKVVIDTLTNAPLLDENGNPIPLLKDDGEGNVVQVTESDKLLMPARQALAQGVGIPQDILNGTGEGLPDEFVLDAGEQEVVQTAVAEYNSVIESVCGARGIPVADMYGLFDQVDNEGYNLAGFRFNNNYISGSFYSLDGLHPSILGQALIANTWLESLNSNFGMSIPLVDVQQLMYEIEPNDNLF